MKYITNAVDLIARWIVLSSANPSEVSLTIKGALVGALPLIMAGIGLAHLNIGQDAITPIFDTIASIVQGLLTLVSLGVMLYGMLRKVWLSIKGTNQVNAGRAL